VPTSATPVTGSVSEGAPAPVAILWRLAIFTLATSVGVLGLRVVVPPLSALVEAQTGVRLPAFILTLSGGLLIGHWWTFRVTEPNGWSLVGLGRSAFSLRRIAIGAALGAAAVGVPSALLLALGWLRIEAAPTGDIVRAAALALAMLLPAALWEELLARGYLFALVRERWGARVAIVATSLLFGLLHVENAGATAQSIALVTLAGIFLGSILVAQRSLYAAWAAHVAWNFVMAGVMHTSVSGVGMGSPNYRTVDAGPDWATGGAWGPEAGIFAGLGMVAAIYFLLRRRAGGGAGDND
jgi:hypothetical protein